MSESLQVQPDKKSASQVSLSQAMANCSTGDLFLFRGNSAADWAIRTLTNAPVNHVGMAVVLDDMPPLIWHAELGRGLTCVWCNRRHRGVQLHDLELACRQWIVRYKQRGWWRQLVGPIDQSIEDSALRVIARQDGLAFPPTSALVGRWLLGRAGARADFEQAYCAEVVGSAYQEMGLQKKSKAANWYDPGRFWSGDDLDLAEGFSLSAEIELKLDASPATNAG